MWVDPGSTDTARRRVAGNRGVVVTRASFMTSSVMRLSLLLVYVAVVSVAANVTDARDQRQTGTQQTSTRHLYRSGVHRWPIQSVTHSLAITNINLIPMIYDYISFVVFILVFVSRFYFYGASEIATA